MVNASGSIDTLSLSRIEDYNGDKMNDKKSIFSDA